MLIMDAYYYREGWVDHLACILYTGNLQNENCENYFKYHDIQKLFIEEYEVEDE